MSGSTLATGLSSRWPSVETRRMDEILASKFGSKFGDLHAKNSGYISWGCCNVDYDQLAFLRMLCFYSDWYPLCAFSSSLFKLFSCRWSGGPDHLFSCFISYKLCVVTSAPALPDVHLFVTCIYFSAWQIILFANLPMSLVPLCINAFVAQAFYV